MGKKWQKMSPINLHKIFDPCQNEKKHVLFNT